MISKATRTALALLFATALLGSACGSSATTTTTSSTDTAASPTEEAEEGTTADAGQSSSSDTDADPSSASTESPLADLLGIPFSDNDAMNEYFGQLQRDAEAKIAECMLSQGFEYKVAGNNGVDVFDGDIDFESRSFAEEYGFGIASDPFEESFEAFQNFEDPNQAYLDSLSQGEVEAYQTALSGVLPDFDSSEAVQSFEPSGCQGEAFEEVFSFAMVFEQFGSQLEEAEEQFEADPRIVRATAGWAGCMAEAGYRYTDVDGAEADFQRQVDQITNDSYAYEDEDDADSVGSAEFDAIEPDDSEVYVFGPRTLRPEFQSQVDAIAVEERAVAVASWDCNEPLRAIEDEVRIEYEQRFVDQNGAAIRAALGE